jgi:hypothetical protein
MYNKSDLIKKKVQSIAALISGEYSETIVGVPRIIYRSKKLTLSIVYISRTNKWKAFYPYPANDQKRKYFDSLVELLNFLERVKNGDIVE